VDGDTATAWSDAYVQPATALLPQISAARPADWVSLSWSPARRVGGLQAWFLSDAQHTRPATVGVSAWDGARWRPVAGVRVTWPASAADPAAIVFPPIRTTALRLDMTSSRPETPSGFLGIAELRATPA
jgi:beta-galactosidase